MVLVRGMTMGMHSKLWVSGVIFLGLICLQSVSAVAAQELVPGCILSSDLRDDQKLRDALAQPCAKQWAQLESENTMSRLRALPMYSLIKNSLPNWDPSNPRPANEIAGGELLVEGGSLILTKNGKRQVLVERTSLPPGAQVNEVKMSPDGKKFLYSLTYDGSDVAEWLVYDLQTMSRLADPPVRIRLWYITWAPDSKGYFYSRWPDRATEESWIKSDAPRRFPVVFHALGSSSSDDRVIFENPERTPSMVFAVERSLDGRYYMALRYFPVLQPMSIYVAEELPSGQSGPLAWRQVKSPGEVPLVRSSYLGRVGDDLFFLSSRCGARLCITKIPIQSGDKETVVIQQDKSVIISAQLIGGLFYLQHLDERMRTTLAVRDLSGIKVAEFRPQDWKLPRVGRITSIVGNDHSKSVGFTFSSFNSYPASFRFDVGERAFSKQNNSKPAPNALSSVVTEVKYYKSLDGTRVPIQVMRRKDSKGPASFALLTYYGAINLSTLASYSSRYLSVLNMGGIVAIANVRGGGELGEKWSRAGALDKSKTIADIASASRWLKRNYKIRRDTVIASGGSWGGAHTYMTAIQYPKDFAGFISLVPVANVTYAFKGLFGWLLPDDVLFKRSPSGDFEDYSKSLDEVRKWSPMQNVGQMVEMKPVLTIGAANDERTGSEQNYMMSLALRDRFGQGASIELIETGGGHGGRALTEELTYMSELAGVSSLSWP